MMIIAEFSIIPIGTGTTSVSKYVKRAIDVLKRHNVKITTGAMGTIIEAESLNDIFMAVKSAHEAMFELGINRVVTELKMDDRRDKESTVESKLKAVN